MNPITKEFIRLGQERFGSSHGWQTQFAKALGMGRQSLRPYLNGKVLPGRLLLERLQAARFDIKGLQVGASTMVHESMEAYKATPYVVQLERENKALKEEVKLLRSMLSPAALKLIEQSKEGKK